MKMVEAERPLPPRWGKGRDGGGAPMIPTSSRSTSTLLIRQPSGLTPTQPSPIEGEGGLLRGVAAVLAAIVALASATAALADPAVSGPVLCDRICLQGAVDQVLAAMVAHDPK